MRATPQRSLLADAATGRAAIAAPDTLPVIRATGQAAARCALAGGDDNRVLPPRLHFHRDDMHRERLLPEAGPQAGQLFDLELFAAPGRVLPYVVTLQVFPLVARGDF